MTNIFENFSKYELDDNDFIILKRIHELTKEPKQLITLAFRILPTGYELDKDTGNLVEFIMNNTIYRTPKKALDVMKTLQNHTNYLRYVGTLNNGGPSEMCLSPLGVLRVYEYDNKELIHYILKGLYFVYNREPAIALTTIKNRPNTMQMYDFYQQLFKDNDIGFEVFRNIFYGLKELGYIEGMGGIETLQANELKLTGLGVKYIENNLNKPIRIETEVSDNNQQIVENKEETTQKETNVEIEHFE